MSNYTEALTKLFDELNIDPDDDFEKHSYKLRSNGSRTVEPGGYVSSKTELKPALTKFESSIRTILEAPKKLYSGTGIHQFGLSTKPRIGEDSIKKALFLSDLPTVFTGQRLSIFEEDFVKTPDGTDEYTSTFEISENLIRDLHKY